jgi:Raf kinase inhibitor-like YbhB/YbcL family protein
MFVLLSTAINSNAPIPTRYTCEGDDISPPLSWVNPPENTRSFVLIVDDPDAPDPAAPKRIWVHWIRYNIGGEMRELAEGAGSQPLSGGELELTSDAGSAGYHGPCPPIGRHRYFFRLFALDAVLPPLSANAKRSDLERAMAGHVIATAVLMGSYQKQGTSSLA